MACSPPAPTASESRAARTSDSATASAATAGDEGYDALVEEGARLARAGELETARSRFAAATKLAPRRIEARYGLGVVSARQCWLSRRECDACISRLTAIIAEGGYRHAEYNRGQCHSILGDHEQARADLDAALRKAPDDPDALVARGATLIQLGRPSEACRDLERAKSLGSAIDQALNAVCPALGPAATCTDQKWGGWAGSPACAKTAARVVPGAHRACAADKDCVKVGTDCSPHAVSIGSLDAYGRVEVPCANPAAGPCAPVSAPRCESGCCVVRR